MTNEYLYGPTSNCLSSKIIYRKRLKNNDTIRPHSTWKDVIQPTFDPRQIFRDRVGNLSSDRLSRSPLPVDIAGFASRVSNEGNARSRSAQILDVHPFRGALHPQGLPLSLLLHEARGWKCWTQLLYALCLAPLDESIRWPHRDDARSGTASSIEACDCCECVEEKLKPCWVMIE